MDALNQMATGIGAAEGGARLSPGEYAGMTGEPIQKDWEGKTFWEIPLICNEGKTNVTIWDFDNDDIAKMQDPNHKDKIEKKIARTKRMYVDLGVWSDEEAQSASWSAGPHSVVGAMAKLANRQCTIVIMKRTDDPSKTITFVNAPKKHTGGNQAAPTVPGSTFDGSTPSLEDIPF